VTTPIALMEVLDGPALRRVFASASQHLRDSAKAIDAINVYPVPDGDTGTNMSATMREAIERVVAVEGEPSVPDVLSTIARGALYGARGNSGVILSQALRGFAAGVGERPSLDGHSLAEGLVRAAEQAYRAVSNPQEGTMLTVLREAGDAARTAAASLPAGGRDTGCARVLAAAVLEAERAEAYTIEQLPALKEAGVPDAGGEGICVLLRGLLAAITGGAIEVKLAPAERPLVHPDEHGEDQYGFCTEFLIESEAKSLDVEDVRRLALANGNRSVVVVGEADLVRVHAHSLEPQALLDAAGKLGKLARVKVEDMTAQNVRWRDTGSGAGAKVAVLAMSRGEGLDEIFAGLGAVTSDLGIVEKPPAGQIASAADALKVADVIVLPNHKNVLLAAEQAKELAHCTLHVVPTISLPQGVAAAMVFDASEPASANKEAMAAAVAEVTTIEVTIAGASRTADGVTVREGEAIVLVDGTLIANAATTREALLAGLAHANVAAGSLVTLYAGEDVSEDEYTALAEEIRNLHPGIEVEAVPGGQPLYPYVASVE